MAILIGLCAIGVGFVAYQVWLIVRDLRRRRAPVAAPVEAPLPAWVDEVGALIAAARDPDPATLARRLAGGDPEVVARAMIVMIAGDELATARRLGDAAIAAGDAPDLRHQAAVIALLEADQDTAERHLRAAIADRPFGPSSISLAILLLRRGDTAEAGAAPDAALAHLPDDPLAHRLAVVARAHAGQLDEARAALARAPLDNLERVELAAEIAAIGDGARPAHVDRFPTHAQLALARGRELIDAGAFDAAIPVLRHAHRLDPLGLEIAGDLGFALSRAGDDAAALAHYDALIGRLPGGDLLRLNRGNVRSRLGDHEGAVTDFRFLLDQVPGLAQARVGLISALATAGRRDDASAELETLAGQGVPREIISELRAQIDLDGRGTPPR